MASAVVRVFRSRAFQGWCVLLLCAELLGIAIVGGIARNYDFRAFYAAGHLSRTSLSHLYDLGFQKAVEDHFVAPFPSVKPFYHPSFEALLFILFSLLSYGPAYLASIALNCSPLGFAYVTGPRHTAFPLARHARAFTFFTFLPVFLTIVVGRTASSSCFSVAWRISGSKSTTSGEQVSSSASQSSVLSLRFPSGCSSLSVTVGDSSPALQPSALCLPPFLYFSCAKQASWRSPH